MSRNAAPPSDVPEAIGPDAASRQDFIHANTAILVPPHVPELRLHLASEAFGLWHRTEEELQRIGLPPPYWAFAWAGGQALARYLLDNPDTAHAKPVIEIGTGCGIAAIAAAICGAGSVIAYDIDPFAVIAAKMNASLNGAELDVRLADPAMPPANLVAGFATPSLILIGDLFYERGLAADMRELAFQATNDGHTVLVGDPSRAYLPGTGELKEIACYEVPVTRALEDAEIRRTRVFRFIC